MLVPRALPPPVPPKITRAHAAALREIDNQPQPSAPVIFTEFKSVQPTLPFKSTLSLFSSAQALVSPFPSFEYSLLDGAGDDDAIVNLQEHLRRRIDERHRLNLVKLVSSLHSFFYLHLFLS